MRLADAATADRIRQRVAQSIQELAFDFPGDPTTGILREDEDSLQAFEEFANEAACPVLDPATGTCDLYAHRPMTCRTFGPPVRVEEGGYGICELCFIGAPAEAVAAAELHLPPEELEASLDAEVGEGHHHHRLRSAGPLNATPQHKTSRFRKGTALAVPQRFS